MNEQATQLQPFHETIVDAITRASVDQLKYLGELIMVTEIPEGPHRDIAEAWVRRTNELYPTHKEMFAKANNMPDVVAHLLCERFGSSSPFAAR